MESENISVSIVSPTQIIRKYILKYTTLGEIYQIIDEEYNVKNISFKMVYKLYDPKSKSTNKSFY